MRDLKQGDPCPCCGKPIQTDDPLVLRVLSALAELFDRPEWEKKK